MKEISYKNFSFQTHQNNWDNNKPNMCQFELTFKCDLHCKHCYSDCYNNPYYIKKELNTKEVKFILDKVYKAGVIWLCFTGGDPLAREDFLDIYSYAKNKGFIIIIFTNGYSMTKKIADYLQNIPPFVIEITLNAITKKTYEDISGVKDSFEKTMAGIDMVIKRKLPLKIKTQVTRQNIEELERIKGFVQGLGLRLRPSPMLHARLDGDISPSKLRITPQQALDIDNKFRPITDHPTANQDRKNKLFRCAIGTSDGFHVDPYGNMLPCSSIRKPVVNLLESNISKAHSELSSRVRMRNFVTNSKCRYCELRDLCRLCPGSALLETGNMESSIGYFCELAYLSKRHFSRSTKIKK
jgi:radical SAM protein with 4Fe4S-binding SPASM domain